MRLIVSPLGSPTKDDLVEIILKTILTLIMWLVAPISIKQTAQSEVV